MNVLVVDDQYDVVQGVVGGVNWSGLGVSRVFTAHGVEQACAVLNEHPVHVLLCDIELPPRNGFEVLDYIHDHDLPTQSIFLTAHASFEYARTAVKKGGFDYLLQPAPYEEIEQAVSKALTRFRETQSIEQDREYGRYWRGKEELLLDSCLSKYFYGGNRHDADALIENLKKLGLAVSRDTAILPALFDSSAQGEWKAKLRGHLAALLDRFFPGKRRAYCIADMQEDGLLVLMMDGETDPAEITAGFAELCGRNESLKAACYLGERVGFDRICQEYGDLCRRQRDNVAGYTGVIRAASGQTSDPYMYTRTDMQRWASYLAKGEWEQVRAEALNALKTNRDRGVMDAAYLARFHQDFTQMFLTAAKGHGSDGHIFYDDYSFDDFLDAYTSYEKMVALVKFATGYIGMHAAEDVSSVSPVEQAVMYVQQHIDQNLSCQDIADAVHLNSSHLTRLFKREKGITLNDFVTSEKMRVAASLLKITKIPVSMIAVKVGYTSFSYFSQVFRKYRGLSPLEYRQQATEENESND